MRGENQGERGVIFQELKHGISVTLGESDEHACILVAPRKIGGVTTSHDDKVGGCEDPSKLVFMLEQNLMQGSYWAFSIVIIIKKKEKLFEITDCELYLNSQ